MKIQESKVPNRYIAQSKKELRENIKKGLKKEDPDAGLSHRFILLRNVEAKLEERIKAALAFVKQGRVDQKILKSLMEDHKYE